ncbi:hypothetical protein SRHO_G00095320, partial [Serrasalmus rhombeus]
GKPRCSSLHDAPPTINTPLTCSRGERRHRHGLALRFFGSPFRRQRERIKKERVRKATQRKQRKQRGLWNRPKPSSPFKRIALLCY